MSGVIDRNDTIIENGPNSQAMSEEDRVPVPSIEDEGQVTAEEYIQGQMRNKIAEQLGVVEGDGLPTNEWLSIEDFYDKPLQAPIVPPLAKEEEEIPITPSAKYLLKCAIKEMTDRETEYDTPEGERSMASTVGMFNILCNLGMTERQGWMFMAILKMVRSEYNGYRKDDYVDGAAYFGLGGECAAKE